MTRPQYTFLIAVLLVWMAWAAGWVVIAAIVAGLVAIAVIAAIEGDLDVSELTDRIKSKTS